MISQYLEVFHHLKGMKHELIFSAMKNTLLHRSDNPNKNISYETADSEIKRQLKMFDDNETLRDL